MPSLTLRDSPLRIRPHGAVPCHSQPSRRARILPGALSSVFFLGNRPADYKVAVLIDAFMRLVQASLHQYETGCRHIETYYNTHDRIAMSHLILGSSYFESCLTNVHRAIGHMRKLKGREDIPSAVKAALPKCLVFIEEDAAKRIQDLRDTIQHFDEQVMDGKVPEAPSLR